jgi:anthranilate/para-aminobenzoate synthase component II
MPEELIATARSSDNEVMGIRHRRMAVEGVQFRPLVESQDSNICGDRLTRVVTVHGPEAVG